MAEKHTPYDIPRYTVIDGQQRLSTLTILLCAIRDMALENAKEYEKEKDMISAKKLLDLGAEIDKKYLVDEFKSDLQHFKIISRSKDRNSLLELINQHQPIETCNVNSAYSFFKAKIEKSLTNRAEREITLRKLLNITTKQPSGLTRPRVIVVVPPTFT
jgi:uncharacterized protein with ParB-like and HNH nuclease domain